MPFSLSEDRSGAAAGYMPEGGTLQPYGVPLAMAPQAMAAGIYPPVPGMYGLGGLPPIPGGYQPVPYGQWPVPAFVPGGLTPEMVGIPPMGVPPGMIPAGGAPPYMVPPVAAVDGVILAAGMPVSPLAVSETNVKAAPDASLAEPQGAGEPQPPTEPAAENPEMSPAPLVEQMGGCNIQETEVSVASGVKA